jgi:valyl-tRNA synthetase
MRIDLKAIVEQSGIDFNSFALALFPHNKHSHMALRRAMDKNTMLNESQVYLLAKMLDVEIQDLYTSGWKLKANGSLFTFTKDGYTAVLDRAKSKTSIYGFDKACELEHKFIDSISLSDYLSLIQSIIVSRLEYNKNAVENQTSA